MVGGNQVSSQTLFISTDVLCRKCTRWKTLRFRFPPLSFSYYRLSIVFTRLMCEIRIHLKDQGGLSTGYVTVSTRPVWADDERPGNLEYKHSKVLQSQDASPIFHTQQKIPVTSIQDLTLVLAQTMITCPFCYWNDDFWNFLLVPWLGNPKNKTTKWSCSRNESQIYMYFQWIQKRSGMTFTNLDEDDGNSSVSYKLPQEWFYQQSRSRTRIPFVWKLTSNDKILVGRVYSWFEGWLSNLTWTCSREERDSRRIRWCERGTIRWLDVMNECIDSTMGRIHVFLMCCLPVTIRGLVGSYNWLWGWSSSLGAQKVGRFLDTSA
jgi:hypothetical protein